MAWILSSLICLAKEDGWAAPLFDSMASTTPTGLAGTAADTNSDGLWKTYWLTNTLTFNSEILTTSSATFSGMTPAQVGVPTRQNTGSRFSVSANATNTGAFHPVSQNAGGMIIATATVQFDNGAGNWAFLALAPNLGANSRPADFYNNPFGIQMLARPQFASGNYSEFYVNRGMFPDGSTFNRSGSLATLPTSAVWGLQHALRLELNLTTGSTSSYVDDLLVGSATLYPDALASFNTTSNMGVVIGIRTLSSGGAMGATFTNVSVVPEPAIFGPLLIGLVALLRPIRARPQSERT